MIGLEITTIDLKEKLLPILLSIIIVLIARSAAVYISTLTLKTFPQKYKHIINWGGLKGSLSIALALSLPSSFQGREDILIFTFSIVLFSLLFQGLTIKTLLKLFKISDLKPTHQKYETLLLAYFKAKYAINSLNKSKEDGLLTEHDVTEESREYEDTLIHISNKLKEMESAYPELKKERISKAKEKVLYSQYKAIDDMISLSLLSEEVAEDEKKIIVDSIEKHLFE